MGLQTLDLVRAKGKLSYSQTDVEWISVVLRSVVLFSTHWCRGSQ